MNAKFKRFESIDRLKVCIVRRWRSSDAENTLTVRVAEPVLDLLKGRRGLEGNVRPAPFDLEDEGLASARADDLLHIGEALDRTSVDGQH